jgi:hypothetical protein
MDVAVVMKQPCVVSSSDTVKNSSSGGGQLNSMYCQANCLKV